MKNYMPAIMLSVMYKIFTKIIFYRIRSTLYFDQLREQSSLRKKYSTMDRIHVINEVIEKFAEYNQPLYKPFVDYENLFDSVEIPAVIEPLRNQELQEACLNILGNIYKDSTATWVLHKKSRKLSFKKGVRATRRNLSKAIHSMLRSIQAWEDLEVRINSEYFRNLTFADILVLFSDTGEKLLQMIEDFNRESVRVGLKIRNLGDA